MKLDFKVIGFDIRQKNFPRLSADLCVWERDEVVYESVKTSLNLTENYFQILNLDNNELRLVKEQLRPTQACIIAMSISKQSFDFYASQIYNLADNMADFESEKFDFDICDLDGFFSFFDMQTQITKVEFDNMDWVEGMALVKKADRIIPAHSPFGLIKIDMIK